MRYHVKSRCSKVVTNTRVLSGLLLLTCGTHETHSNVVRNYAVWRHYNIWLITKEIKGSRELVY